MIIIEKTNQIGILTTQGLPYSALKNIFMIQGSFIGLCGGFFGGCLAALLIFIQLQYEILKFLQISILWITFQSHLIT